MKNTENTRSEMMINAVERETEKAVLVNVMVSWNGSCKSKSIWMPKSVCEVFTAEYDGNRTHAMVADWFIAKTQKANTWNGYEMQFETLFAKVA